MQIQAAVVREKAGPFVIETLELAEPRDNEVLVEVVATGLCHTDLVVRDQHYPTPLPAVLGHEGAGIVRRVGSSVSKLVPGDHVVMTFASCGHCKNCRSAYLPYCDHGFEFQFKGRRPDNSHTISADGQPVGSAFFHQSSFATYAIATERNTVKVSPDAPLELLGPLACGVQTGVGAVVNSLKCSPGSSLVVFGVGAVGLSAVMGAVIAGCSKIIAVDLNESRLSLAMSLGATHTVNAKQRDSVVAAIREICGGGADFSLEMTANPKVLRQAVDCLGTRGVCGQIGASPIGTEASLDMNGIMSGRTVRGIIEGDAVPDDFIPQMVEWFLQGRLPFDRFVKFYRFDEINQAAGDAESGAVVKPILRIKTPQA